ncbi:MAG TPA: glycogen debranching N-terminal domain-containing protein, partial [Myxococcales bacterium]|nr:glycogen debranching N-terminal domain-containing protein [Myxococcales bacterium]
TMPDRALVIAKAAELLGYDDLASLPESTGTDKLVLKRGNLFAVAGRLGDIWPPGARDQGAYFEDTRFLSKLRLAVAGGPPVVLSTQTRAEYISQVDLTVTSAHFGGVFQDPVNFLHLRREQLIEEHFVERLTLTNYLVRDIDYWVEYEFASDFADQFEVRGAKRHGRGTYFKPLVRGEAVVSCYQGRDGVLYRVEVFFPTRAPQRLEAGKARFEFHLGPNESASLEVHALPSVHSVHSGASVRESADAARRPGYRPRPPASEEPESGWLFPGSHPASQPPAPRRFDERLTRARADYRQWAEASSRILSNEEALDGALAQAIADLKALSVFWEGRRVISAGVPWYASPFGRDALIAGFQALLVNPDIAREALLFLAAHQGKQVDDFREEEPGKILHEIRRGELARTGEVPHTPYYGSVDSTPLFLVLFTEYLIWTNDRATGEQLLPAAEAALRWIDQYGDKDGDGFIEYQQKTKEGLRNQGWKDSWNGVPHLDGTPAEPPIALVEVQGYCIDARRRMARLYRHLGRREEAARCMLAAQRMVRRLDEAFWMEKQGTYALALDGEKRQVQSVTSNPGHLLFSRAVPGPRARRVARTLMSADSFSGFGIRTLARGQRAYNPLSYHDGTVWPHDNSLIAMGFSNYGMQRLAAQVLSGAYDACRQFRHYRLPELFCGMARGEGDLVVNYPVSCAPQAWASGALFLMLRACLGLYPDAQRRTLKIANPHLPPPIERLRLERLRIGGTRLTLELTRTGESCFAAVREMEGEPLSVRIEVGAQQEE